MICAGPNPALKGEPGTSERAPVEGFTLKAWIVPVGTPLPSRRKRYVGLADCAATGARNAPKRKTAIAAVMILRTHVSRSVAPGRRAHPQRTRRKTIRAARATKGSALQPGTPILTPFVRRLCAASRRGSAFAQGDSTTGHRGLATYLSLTMTANGTEMSAKRTAGSYFVDSNSRQ